MTKSKEDNRTTTTTTSRFGGSVYRSKSRSFTKENPETVTKTSEFTLNDAISPVSVTRNSKNNGTGSNGRDLLAEISFDDSRNNLSIYESVASSSANSSFDVMHSSPTRYPQSKHVSFDGSNISYPASPDKRGNHSTNGRRGEVTPDRIVSLSPIYANDQKASRMSSSTSTAVSIDDESDVTVPTSNLVLVDHGAVTSLPSKPTQSMDDASMSSHASYDEFGVVRNAYETSTNGVSKTVTTDAICTNTSEDTNDNTQTEELNGDIVKAGSARNVSNISEPTSLTEDANAPEPKKASWMKYLRPLNLQESEEKVEDQQSDIPDNEPVVSVWKPSRPFEMVNMYQDPKEITPVLFMVESKRQCWFQQEMDAIRREWQYYKKLIRDNVQEVIRVEDMLRSSHDAFCDYVKHIDDMIVDLYVNENGELLSKKEKTKMMKRRSDAGNSGELHTHDRDAVDDMKDLNVWLTPMIESFSTVQGEIKTQLPFFEECLMDVISLKQEMRARGKELDEKGNTLNLHVMEQAESNIQDSFDALMNVIDELERTQREEMRKAKASASSIGSTTGTSSSSSDGVLRSFLDETKTDEPFQIHDRWLYESQYRYAAKLGLLSWKENRKDYEFWYAEIIALHEERKCRLNEVLLSFLPRRKELLLKLHVALMSGSESLDETKISTEKETRTIDKAIERNAVSAMKNDPTKYADLTMDVVFFNPKVKSSTGAASTKYARSSTDLWKSALIRERRLVELKVNKDEYKLAVCIVTLDDSMHVFIMTDELLNDTSTSGTASTSGAIPFDSTLTTQPLDYYTKRMSTSVTTKIPPVEYSIKLMDYDISIVGDTNDTNSSKNPFGSSSDVKIPTELELLRKARSVIFRKREDHITIRVPSKKDAVKFLRNRLPVGERLTEI